MLAAGLLGCTVDDPQVTAVGAVRILPVNPAIVPQSVSAVSGGSVSGNRMQTTLWKITRAELHIDDRELDLLTAGGGPPECEAMDTPMSATVALGGCLDFIVVEAFDEAAAVQATLMLEFSARLKRVTPVVEPLVGDVDGDGVLNGNDNCILIHNPGQEDTGRRGFGDACRVVDIFDRVELDSDADGVADSLDNCVHIANPSQANPPSPEYSAIESFASDGIGFACEATSGSMNTTEFKEEIVDIAPKEVAITFDFVLPSSQAFVVIDFNDAVVFPDCDWNAGPCDPVTDAIQVCVRTAGSAAQGCG